MSSKRPGRDEFNVARSSVIQGSDSQLGVIFNPYSHSRNVWHVWRHFDYYIWQRGGGGGGGVRVWTTAATRRQKPGMVLEK